MLDFRRKLQKRGLDARSAAYVQASWKPKTILQYAVHVKKWKRYCRQKHWHKHQFTVPKVVRFLTYLKDKLNVGFSSVAAARSALAAYASMVDPTAETVFQDSLISRVMKGISNKHPPKQKYHTIWDPAPVLRYIRALPDNEDLTLLQLTEKLAFLAAIVTGSRCQALFHIKRANITESDTCFCCRMPKTLKTSKRKAWSQVLHLAAFPDRSLCVHATLQHYLDRTRELRDKDQDKLFIITTGEHTPATVSTISRWVRNMMEKGGIDISVYKTHSTRKASTSKAAEVFVPLSTIIKAAGWTTGNTFAQYYKFPVVDHTTFGHAVLGQGPALQQENLGTAVHIQD